MLSPSDPGRKVAIQKLWPTTPDRTLEARLSPTIATYVGCHSGQKSDSALHGVASSARRLGRGFFDTDGDTRSA